MNVVLYPGELRVMCQSGFGLVRMQGFYDVIYESFESFVVRRWVVGWRFLIEIIGMLLLMTWRLLWRLGSILILAHHRKCSLPNLWFGEAYYYCKNIEYSAMKRLWYYDFRVLSFRNLDLWLYWVYAHVYFLTLRLSAPGVFANTPNIAKLETWKF